MKLAIDKTHGGKDKTQVQESSLQYMPRHNMYLHKGQELACNGELQADDCRGGDILSPHGSQGGEPAALCRSF